ncbi:MAG: cation transporter [Eubacteriales bacterium]|nr:cation transporter [Eubacteriales bacterium]
MTNLLIRLFIKNKDDTHLPSVRARYGMLSGLTGIILNLLLFAGKLIAGLLTASLAIQADAFNNLSDAGSSIVNLISFKLSSRPADADHPFGHGRYEYVGGLIVSFVILIVGFELGKSSVEAIFRPTETVFSVVSLCIMIASILAKLWLLFFNRAIGKRIHSEAVIAAANDSLGDIISTGAVVLCLLIFRFTGLNLDAYAGVAVSVFILITGLRSLKETLDPLIGEKPSAELVHAIEQEVLSYDGIIGIHDLIVHSYGEGTRLISLHAEVDGRADVFAVHDLIDNIERDIQKKFGCQTVIHMDPINTDDSTLALRNQIAEAVRAVDARLLIHDFRAVSGPTHTNVIFDAVVPFDMKQSDADIRAEIEKSIRALNETYCAVITIDRPYSGEN